MVVGKQFRKDVRRLLLCTDSVERLESRSSQCAFGGFRVFSTWDYGFLIDQSEFSTLRAVPGLLIDKPWYELGPGLKVQMT